MVSSVVLPFRSRMLEENKDAWRKQQYTATRAWKVLKGAHPELENSSLLVQRCIHERKVSEGICTQVC